MKKVAIIGGGIMGITLGYYLVRKGVQVDILEASPVLGGLAGPIQLDDGSQIDRFYHAILSSDRYLNELCTDLGIADQLRFKETRTGFYYRGKIFSMNNIIEFLKFPPLGWIDRFRLGLTVLAAQFIRDWHSLEGVSVEDWLMRWSGKNTFNNIWRPMLKAKFDGGFSNTPATYIWSRLVRMKSTRGGVSQKEMSGHLLGGYITLLDAMAKQIQASGSSIFLKTPVQEIVIQDGVATGLRIQDQFHPYDAVVATVQAPIFTRLIPGADPEYQNYLKQTEYLGIICPVLVMDRPLTGYWTLNITDESIPFTGVIETTAYIEPKTVGGHHLVYLPKYTAPGSDWQKMSDEDVRETWSRNLQTMFPDFDPKSIQYFLVHREKFVEPIHPLNSTALIPGIETPIKNLFLSTTAQIYPALTNGESVTQHAHASADLILDQFEAHQLNLTPSGVPVVGEGSI
jgi:protoporphyrinogen oxidase